MGPDRDLTSKQIALVICGYLVATLGFFALLDNEFPGGGGLALGIWTLASILLGVGTGRFAFALLAFAVIPISIPFGFADADEFAREPLPLWVASIYLAIYAWIVVTVAVLTRLGVDYLRRRRAAS